MTFTYFPNLPNAPDYPGDDQPGMQTNAASTNSILAVDHVSFNVSSGGTHKQVTFSSNNEAAVTASVPVLFTNTQDGAGNALPGGIAQLFMYTGTAAQSKNQYNSLSTGSVLLFGGIILKWGYFTTVAGAATVTFANAFPNSGFLALATVSGTGASDFVSTSIPSTTSFTVRTKNAAGTATAVNGTYLAIGN